MGCVQSQQPRDSHHSRPPANLPPNHPHQTAPGLALPTSHRTNIHPLQPQPNHTPDALQTAGLLRDGIASVPVAAPVAPVETEVMKRASAFDKLHEDAHRPPQLQDVKVVVGEQSKRLLDGFEAKEAQARAMPQLVDVESTDLRQSKLYDKLKEFEENDARVRREPKLEKTFIQREKEKEKEKEMQREREGATDKTESTAISDVTSSPSSRPPSSIMPDPIPAN